MGAHGPMYVKWKSEEFYITPSELEKENEHIIAVAILQCLSKGILIPNLESLIKKLTKDNLEWVFKELNSVIFTEGRQKEKFLMSLNFLRNFSVKNSGLLSANSIYFMINLHISYMETRDIMEVLKNEDFTPFTQGNIKEMIKKTYLLPYKDKQKMLNVMDDKKFPLSHVGQEEFARA